ncbi:MAG: 3-deoxy-manno-octulosonate cytidylyltransferase [Opitutales bacterium]|nr:3-deoxy-manno-octulosonate cytidylyltransferase [Opitutales bacterium]
MPNHAIIVPARLASQRFPRKLLHPVRGKPLILWTAERVRSEVPEIPLYFAVAEPELAEVLDAAGFRTIATDPELASGTDRIAQANREVAADFVINVQADEPLVTGEQIRTLDGLIQSGVAMATLARPIRERADFVNPNRVKVVCDSEGRALYFSRSPIPHQRGESDGFAAGEALLHLGLYAYTADFLQKFQQWPAGRLEGLERLEQLRALENGASIAVGFTEHVGIGVDTPEDAELLEKALRG